MAFAQPYPFSPLFIKEGYYRRVCVLPDKCGGRRLYFSLEKSNMLHEGSHIGDKCLTLVIRKARMILKQVPYNINWKLCVRKTVMSRRNLHYVTAAVEEITIKWFQLVINFFIVIYQTTNLHPHIGTILTPISHSQPWHLPLINSKPLAPYVPTQPHPPNTNGDILIEALK